MLGQKRNDSLFGPGSRTIEAPQSVLEKQEAALEGSPLDEAVQPPFETQAPATAFTAKMYPPEPAGEDSSSDSAQPDSTETEDAEVPDAGSTDESEAS